MFAIIGLFLLRSLFSRLILGRGLDKKEKALAMELALPLVNRIVRFILVGVRSTGARSNPLTLLPRMNAW